MIWRCVFILLLCGSINNAFCQEAAEKKKGDVVVKYKKYEKFDLGQLSIKGDFASPSDIFIQQEASEGAGIKLYNRREYGREIFSDVINLK